MENFFQIFIGVISVGVFLLILVGFWLFGYRFLKKRKIEKYAKIQLWLGPLLGFFTGVILFQYAIFNREVLPKPIQKEHIGNNFNLSEFLTHLVKFLEQVGFVKIQTSATNYYPVYFRKARHMLVKFKEYYQFIDWDETHQDPLKIVKDHQLFREWVDREIKIPKILRGTVAVVVTILVTQDGLDDDSLTWIKDELEVRSGKDWIGGEVQSIITINQKHKIVESLKAQKQGDTIGLNHALDLIQAYLNSTNN